MAEKPNLVHVEIFGQSYAVRAGAERGYVEKLAAHVDAQMREVSRGLGAVDSVRIAVLAALNLVTRWEPYAPLQASSTRRHAHRGAMTGPLIKDVGSGLPDPSRTS